MRSLKAFAILLSLFATQAAFAAPYYFRVDLTRDFEDTWLSIWPDGLPAGTDVRGVDITVPTSRTSDVDVTITTEGEATCTVQRKTLRNGRVVVRVDADIEVDDGVCNVAVRIPGNRRATVSVANIGS